MTEQIKKWWNKNAKEFAKAYKIPADIYYGPGSPNEANLNLIGEVKGKDVLEIGCGEGHCSAGFAKKGANVIGVDISENQLKLAKKFAEKNKVKIKFYQGDMGNLENIEQNSQDIVFTAWALQYAPNLKKCFSEVKRVLKEDGIFVFSLDHPIWEIMDKENLSIKKSYFETGEYSEKFMEGKFVAYYRTISEIVNALTNNGLIIEKMVEPDSRKKNEGDYWYDNQKEYRKEALKWFPRTIIFKARKPR